MYLNDPEAGGETAFPTINGGLKVSPKLGHAILWPSTLDDRPMVADGRTDHEAMPVHAGIKYAPRTPNLADTWHALLAPSDIISPSLPPYRP